MKALTRLAGFKYLGRRRVLALVVILALSSALFSMTAFSLLGFYRGFTAYLGEGGDVVVVYDRRSHTPFTGLVPAYLAERISALNGVLACSPEAIAPCVVKGEPLFLRGILPESFAKLNQLTMIEGGMLEPGDLNYVIVGRSAAERLHVRLGDRVLALGVLTDRYVELQVKGVFASRSPMDDEILAPLHVGQWLRGADYGHVTLIRFKIDRDVLTPSRVFEEVAKEASEPSPPPSVAPGQPPLGIAPRMMVGFRAEDVGVEEAYSFMRSYLDRYGVTRESLLILSAMVFLLSGVSVALASRTIMAQHKGEMSVLRSLGASRRLLKRDVLIKLLPWSLAASSMGLALATLALTAIQERGYLRVLSHSIAFRLDPLAVALNFILVLTLVSVGVLKAELE
jgi:ABC-type lipoprotein release transport system permease subunit